MLSGAGLNVTEPIVLFHVDRTARRSGMNRIPNRLLSAAAMRRSMANEWPSECVSSSRQMTDAIVSTSSANAHCVNAALVRNT